MYARVQSVQESTVREQGMLNAEVTRIDAGHGNCVPGVSGRDQPHRINLLSWTLIQDKVLEHEMSL